MKLRVKMTFAVATALLISPILATPASATSKLDQSTAVNGSAGLSAASDSTTFNYVTTAAQIYVVPSGVTQLTIQARGGDGAGASSPPAFESCGGAGALVTTVVDVNPGETLNIYVADRGIHGFGNSLGSTGGWGYGSGGTGDGYGGGGGGGATAVILSGAPLVVAGGGGGAGRRAGAFGGAAGVSGAGAGASGGSGGARAGAGADGSGAGATGTRAGGSWGTGGAGGPGGTNGFGDASGPGAGGGGYGGGAGGISGGTAGNGGGGGGSMGAGTSTTIATAEYGGTCASRLGGSGYVVITPGDIPNPVSVAETSHPDILQQVGISKSTTCAVFTDENLNWSGVAGGGWSESWAQWVGGGSGGSVCTRTLFYAGRGVWSVRA